MASAIKDGALSPTPPKPDNVTYALFCVFGISSWVTINAIFGELPVFANQLPESWAIATDLTLAIQMANVFPLMYLILTRIVFPRGRVPLPGIVAVLLSVGIVGTAALAFLWDTDVNGQSLWLLILAFISGGVDCTTSVVYWPFVSGFRTVYVSALSVGEGLSGVTSSVLTLVQSPGVENRFSVPTFFLLISGFMVLSAVAFAGLVFLPRAQAERQSRSSDQKGVPADQHAVTVAEREEERQLPKPWSPNWPVLHACREPLLVLLWASFVDNGAIMSVRTFATLPFKDGTNVLLWVGILVAFVDPLAAGLTTWTRFQCNNLKVLTGCWTVLSAIIMGVALSSPNPPFKDTSFGGAFIVIVFVVARCLIAYTRAMSCILVHKSPTTTTDAARAGAATYIGVAIQIGALTGSVLMFLLVHHTTLFASY